MKRSFIVISLFVSTVFSMPTYAKKATDCDNLAGVWTNSSGRIFTIEKADVKTGELSGFYQLPASIDATKYVAKGWVNSSNAVTFAVRWQGWTSISSWIGMCNKVNGKPQLDFIWHQVRMNKSPANERLSTGSITFFPK
ncbi:avidin/streptavidin family protein [Aliikangiella coralliicola]|uniref:Avidin n=1 Tax=Aliikangiella coralliicola TaxID=2592383 RepID=A0A545TV51_9GAMM|nr:avidin/streptavidin family protein [Aliikangiella coralliicola]TQV81096.1 hypothetical protein FLL46_26155 [Aliikangiella coralliicola]